MVNLQNTESSIRQKSASSPKNKSPPARPGSTSSSGKKPPPVHLRVAGGGRSLPTLGSHTSLLQFRRKTESESRSNRHATAAIAGSQEHEILPFDKAKKEQKNSIANILRPAFISSGSGSKRRSPRNCQLKAAGGFAGISQENVPCGFEILAEGDNPVLE